MSCTVSGVLRVFGLWREWCGELYWKGWELKGVDGVQMSG